MSDPVRLALVGCGRIAQVAHLPAVEHRRDDRDHVWQALLTTTAGAVGTVTIAADVPGLPTEGIDVRRDRGGAGGPPLPVLPPRLDRARLHQRRCRGAGTHRRRRLERQVEAFARTIREAGHPVPDVRDGLAAVRLIEATATAVETGSQVKL
jgi:predicted dehydrogenase